MGSAHSAMFEKGVKELCGIQGDTPSGLMTSLPCELAFGALRDSSKRHSKAQKQSPAAIHAVSWKSVKKHPFGCSVLELDDHDWSEPLKKASVKASIHNSLRTTDKRLGISCEGLTRHRNNKAYTKPHVFCQRLDLLQSLSHFYKTLTGPPEDRMDKVCDLYGSLWISNLLKMQTFVRKKGDDDNMNAAMFVLRAGPHSVLCANMVAADVGGFVFGGCRGRLDFEELMPADLDSYEVALSEPQAGDKLSWKRSTGWMPITTFVADHGILDISSKHLTSLCAKMKIKGHGGLNHRHRVELFLKTMQRDESYIESVLAQIPEKPSRKKKDAAEAS
eukprot:Skav209326  [mRNA]  locus=scaffold724:411338:412336:- [translate_table: standard]